MSQSHDHAAHHAPHIDTGAEHNEVHHEAHGNQRSAILIAALAACLAISETAGKSAQTDAVTMTIEESDTWNFYQAKTIRGTVIESDKALLGFMDASKNEAAKAELEAKWAATIERYRSDPKTGEGREELRAKAEHLAHEAHEKLHAYHRFELSSAAFQISIVLASAAIVTGTALLTWVAIAGGLTGLVMGALGAMTLLGL